MTTRKRHAAHARANRPKETARSGGKEETPSTVADVCRAMEAIAPVALAQSWDNVGLLAGDMASAVRKLLLCIDLTPEVVEEVLAARADMVLAYHPPIFKPVRALRAPAAGTEALVFRCIRAGTAIYSPHTALDAAEGGTNDVIARMCGLASGEPLEYIEAPGSEQRKLVIFVPPRHLEQVADAVFAAGAGGIGDYTRCSYRLSGYGTFLGGESSNPTIGERGRFETVEEVRFETVVPAGRVPQVVAALRAAHPYEEPAFDLYPLQSRPVRGIGRVGRLAKQVTLKALAQRIRRAAGVPHVQVVGAPNQRLNRVIVAVGSAGGLPLRAVRGVEDVIITGEMRHHDALTLRRSGGAAVCLGHWASERPVLAVLRRRLRELLAGVSIALSEADRDPFDTLHA